MKAVYYFVTFVAALFVLAFVGWNVYVQWPQIEATVRKSLPPQAPAVKKAECPTKCGSNCPQGRKCDPCACAANGTHHSSDCCKGK